MLRAGKLEDCEDQCQFCASCLGVLTLQANLTRRTTRITFAQLESVEVKPMGEPRAKTQLHNLQLALYDGRANAQKRQAK